MRYLWLLILFTACTDSGSYGNKVGGGEFSVFFPDAKDEGVATDIANYWKENDLLSGNKQDLQLISSGNNYVLKLIAKEPDNVVNMPYAEQKLLYGLRDSLLGLVCDSCNLSIEICDNKFEPKYRIE